MGTYGTYLSNGTLTDYQKKLLNIQNAEQLYDGELLYIMNDINTYFENLINLKAMLIKIRLIILL